jgi:hypothetical protein
VGGLEGDVMHEAEVVPEQVMAFEAAEPADPAAEEVQFLGGGRAAGSGDTGQPDARQGAEPARRQCLQPAAPGRVDGQDADPRVVTQVAFGGAEEGVEEQAGPVVEQDERSDRGDVG